MKLRALEAKDDCSFWSSAKCPKGFSKINDSVKSSLQKRIISHPLLIQSTIENDWVTVKFYNGIIGVKTELCQKVLLQVSVREYRLKHANYILIIEVSGDLDI